MPEGGAQSVYLFRGGFQSFPILSRFSFWWAYFFPKAMKQDIRCSSGHRFLQSGVGLTSRSVWGSWDKQVRAN